MTLAYKINMVCINLIWTDIDIYDVFRLIDNNILISVNNTDILVTFRDHHYKDMFHYSQLCPLLHV